VPTVLKFGKLTLLEPLRPVQACNGIALPFTLFYVLGVPKKEGANQKDKNKKVFPVGRG
jgi:hypothetical protein